MTSGPGRRRAVPAGAEARGGGAWLSAVAAIVLLACCAGLLAWSDSRPPQAASPAQSAREVAIDEVTLVCDGLDGGDSTGSLAVGILPDAPDDGDVNVAGAGAPRRPGSWSVRSEAGATVTARGPVAAATGAWRAGIGDAGSGQGLAVGTCPHPGTEVWFVGAGSTVEHESTLVVSNPGRTPAVFDVTFLTSDGELVPVGTQGIALGPGEQQEIGLASVAADRGDVAVRVSASEGEAAASILDSWTAELEPAGTEWVPVAGHAAESVSVTGVPGGTGARELVLANPGERTVVVHVQVVGPDATFVPESLAEVEVEARSSISVELPRALGDDGLGLRLEADEPVLAAVRVRSSGARPDVAYAVAGPALTGPTMVPVRLGADIITDAPLLSLAPGTADAPATVTIAAYDGVGDELATTSLELPVGVTTTYDPGSGRAELPHSALRKAAYLVLTPGDGAPVRAAATFATARGGVSVLPVTTPRATVLAPAAVPAGG